MTVIEDEKEFCAILAKTLERVRHTTGEVPEITLLEVINEIAALIINSSDADLAI
jgi:hypothetical protein